jgi:hypothetical protein
MNNNKGDMVGNTRCGNVVVYWFEAVGPGTDSTDAVQVAVPFPTEELAMAAAELATPAAIALSKAREAGRPILSV